MSGLGPFKSIKTTISCQSGWHHVLVSLKRYLLKSTSQFFFINSPESESQCLRYLHNPLIVFLSPVKPCHQSPHPKRTARVLCALTLPKFPITPTEKANSRRARSHRSGLKSPQRTETRLKGLFRSTKRAHLRIGNGSVQTSPVAAHGAWKPQKQILPMEKFQSKSEFHISAVVVGISKLQGNDTRHINTNR